MAANYGLKTVVDQRSLDIAARITPLEVDSALTAYALQSAVDTSSEVDSKIAAALLDAVSTAALDAAQGGRKRAGLPALHGGRARRWR